jgi:hypothetical protein
MKHPKCDYCLSLSDDVRATNLRCGIDTFNAYVTMLCQSCRKHLHGNYRYDTLLSNIEEDIFKSRRKREATLKAAREVPKKDGKEKSSRKASNRKV